MNNIMNRLICIVCVTFVYATVGLAQNPSPEVAFWSHALRTEPPKRVLELLGDTANPAWPPIRAAYWIEKQPVADRASYQGRNELAKALLEKLKQGFAIETPATLAEIDKENALYQSAASRISAADGYTNRLLADSLYRMVLFRLSGWLIKHPEAFDEIAVRANRVAVPQPDVSGMLLRYRVEDSELDKLAIDVAAIDPAKSVMHQLKGAGVPEATGWKILVDPAATRPQSLIENPSVALLLGRMAFTEGRYRGLIGMTEYLRKGGKLDPASVNNAREFRRVMGKEAVLYGGRLMEGSTMNMGDLQNFAETHLAGTPAQSLFVEQLFE